MRYLLVILFIYIAPYIVSADTEYRKNKFGVWVEVKSTYKRKPTHQRTTETELAIKLGYKGTYYRDIVDFNLGGGAIGIGVINDNMYIGGDISIEGGEYNIPTLDNIKIRNTTLSVVIGHKYIRAKIGIVISSSTFEDITDKDIGSLLGGQFKIPVSDNFGFFIEPSAVIIGGSGAFSMSVGFEFTI